MKTYIGIGDIIKYATTKLGIPSCQSCERRRAIFNRWTPGYHSMRTMPEISGGASPVCTSTAASASFADVNSVVSAASIGDVVCVPSGSSTWATTLAITKNISLIGDGIGSTVITNGIGSGLFLISYAPGSNNALFRVSGFTFNLNNNRGIKLSNNNTLPDLSQVRIDNNRFHNSTLSRAAIHVFGVRGVIDSNTFNTMTYPLGLGWGSASGGQWDWDNHPELVWGTNNDNIYAEDNTITDIATAVSDSDEGGRYVFRYNSFSGSGDQFPWLDIHGERGSLNGGFGGEVYGNIYSNAGFLISHRGGRLAFFMNKVTNGTGATYNVYNNDACASNLKEVVNNTYVWRNRHGFTGALVGKSSSGGDICPSEPTDAQNVTWWIDNVANDGTVGVGAGTLAQRPATCSTGVAFWATNQSITDLTGMVGVNPSTPISGTLYKCTAPNTWTTYYTPLAYPHPLRTSVTAPAGSSGSVGSQGCGIRYFGRRGRR